MKTGTTSHRWLPKKKTIRPLVLSLAFLLSCFTAGTAWAFTISGTVTDEFANPVANVQVILMGNNNLFTTTTDANGNYQFVNIDGGFRYMLAPNKYEYMPVVNNSQVSGEAIVAIAELELGNSDTDEPDPGRYHGHESKWCSEFVSWVYAQAGEPFTGGDGDGGVCTLDWNMSTAYKVVAGFGRNANWQYLSIDEINANWPGGGEFSLEPQSGDYIFFSNDTGINRAHSGMVDEVVGTDLHTIEGNINGGIVDTGLHANWRTNQTGDTIVKGIGYRRLVTQIYFLPGFWLLTLESDMIFGFIQTRHCRGDAHVGPPLTVAEGVAATPDHGVLTIAQGNYNEAVRVDRPMQIRACPGPVVIGRP